MSTRRPSSIASVGAAAAMLALLSACGPEADPSPAPTATAVTSPSPTPTTSGSAEPRPAHSATPPTAEALGMSCSDLVPPAAVYAFNPNFGLVDGWDPAAGSLGARAVAAGGLACRWLGSGSALLEVSAARPGATGVDAIRHAEAAGVRTPYGEESWFTTDSSGRGQLIILAGSTWISVTSDYLGEPGDADPIVDAAMAALGID